MTDAPWPRVMIHTGLYHTGLVDDETFHTFWAMAQQGTPLIPQAADRTDKAHNKAVVSVLRYNIDRAKAREDENSVTHILFLDADHKHAPDLVAQLSRAVREDPGRMVVAALNFRRSEPWDPCAYEMDDKGDSSVWLSWEPGVYPVSITGMAAMLVNVKVFEQIDWPFFGYDYSHAEKMRWSERHDVDDLGTTRWPGVDIWFCKRCKDAGIQVYVDTRVATSPHLAKQWVTDNMWRRFQHTDRFKWHHAAYASRLARLREVAPALFEKPGRVLYVGATRHRAHYSDELAEAGNVLDLLEIEPDHCAYWREQDRFANIIEGDVRQMEAAGYDHAFWWHGPEHLVSDAMPNALRRLEASVKPSGMVVIGCPWGDGPDGDTLCPSNKHRSAWDAADFEKLGYTAVCDGVKDSDASSLIAYKIVS